MCSHYRRGSRRTSRQGIPDWIGGYYEHMVVHPIWKPGSRVPETPIANGVKRSPPRQWYFNMRFRPEMKGVMEY